MLLIAVCIAAAGLPAACTCNKPPPSGHEVEAAPATAPEAPVQEAAERARQEFELLPDDYADGTSKLYSRGDFLPLDDPKAMSEGDFIGRLRVLFGPVAGDEYVLRHRATGFVVTAYSAQSGPSYGGGPRVPVPPEGPGATPRHADLFEATKARAARVKADPVLSKGRPVDWAAIDIQALSRDQLKALREKERAWMRRLEDVGAGPELAATVARLDALLSSVRPADWEAIRYWGEESSVYRVGIRNGVAFDKQLSIPDGLDYLLAQAERRQPPVKDTSGGIFSGADEQVVEYWLYNASQGERIDDALPRVQVAWFRLVERAKKQPGDLRDILLERAAEQIAPLKLDPRKAEAALRVGR